VQISASVANVDDLKEEPWNGPNGPMWFVQGKFEDGSIFSRGAKSLDNASKLHSEWSGLAGKGPGPWEVEQSGEFQGHKKYKVSSWPGKPERSFGGGGGGGFSGGGAKKEYVPRYKDTIEGVLAEQDSIHRSVALTQAVSLLTGSSKDPVDAIAAAERFYQWLSKDRPTPIPEPTQPAPLAPPGPPAPRETIGSFDPLKDQKDFFGGSLTTGDKIKSQTVQKYLDEFEKAVKGKDVDRVEKLAQMVTKSLEQKTVTHTDIDSWLEPAIVDSRKALRSAEEYDKWYARTLKNAQEKERNSDSIPF